MSDTAVICFTAAGYSGTLRVAVTAGVQVGTISEAVSYDMPRTQGVSDAAMANRPPTSSDSVSVENVTLTLSAVHYGTSDYTVAGRVGGLGHTACESTEWASDSSLSCLWATGSGGSLRVAVTAGVRVGTLTETLSYDGPALVHYDGSGQEQVHDWQNTPAGGGRELVTQAAEALGEAGYSATMRVGATACEFTEWSADTELRCKAPTGVSGTYRLAVTAGMRVGTITEVLSYDAPTGWYVEADTGGNVPSGTGGGDIILIGADFATSDSSVAMRLGFTATEATEWNADTTIMCKTAGGVGGTLRVAVTAGVRSGTLTEVALYDVPTPLTPEGLTSVVTQDHALAAEGVEQYHLTHAALRPADYTSRVRVGSTACEASEWVSDTAVICFTAAGYSGTLRVAVTAGVQVGTISEAVSYDMPRTQGVSDAAMANRPPTSSDSVSVENVTLTLSAVHYGTSDYTVAGRVGGLGHTACESTEWASDSSLSCLWATGSGGSLRVAVTAGVRVGTLTETLSYDGPALVHYDGSGQEQVHDWQNTPAGGGRELVTQAAEALGEAGYSATMRVGATACEFTEWSADTELRCKAPTGVSGTYRLAVTAGMRVGTITEVLSYDAPTGWYVEADTGGNVPSGTGGGDIILIGADFATSDSSVAMRLGFTATEATEWNADTTIMCKTAGGVGGTLRVAVTAGVRSGTLTEVALYDVPTPLTPEGLTSVVTQDHALAAEGVEQYHLTHAALRPADYTSRVRVGSTACEASEWVSDTAVICFTAAGYSGTLRVAVTAGVQVGTISEAVSYDMPRTQGVSDAAMANRPPTSSDSVSVENVTLTLSAVHYGTSDYTVAGRVGGLGHTACESTEWASDSSLSCLWATGSGGSLRVAVTAGVRVGTLTETLSYDGPALVHYDGSGQEQVHDWQNTPAGGGRELVTQAAEALGEAGYSATMRVGATACEFTEWSADTELRCKAPTGVSGTYRLAVTAGMRVGTITEVLSYDAPTGWYVEADTGGNVPSGTGGGDIILIGADFATSDSSVAMRLGFTATEATEWNADTTIMCKTAGGVGGTLRVAVTAGVRSGTLTEVALYDIASVMELTWPDEGNRPAVGGFDVLIAGAGHGLLDYTVTSRVDSTACEATEWGSESDVHCLVSAGLGLGIGRVVITVGVHVGSLLEAGLHRAEVFRAGVDRSGTAKLSSCRQRADYNLRSEPLGRSTRASAHV